jgi:hypothetical protein
MKMRGRQIKQGRGFYKGTLIAGAVVLTLIVNTKVAHADPHGMFYTAIGQQQLFFNVLAALDQADYVETALDREARRQSREEVDAEQPFARETESGGRFTGQTEISRDAAGESANDPAQAGTPALLNRSVTLEGADLYTDQLVREFGAESARRNAAAELLQTLCAFGFGIEGCDDDETNLSAVEKVEAKERKNAAAINNPLDWAAMPFTNGVMGALNSGNRARIIDNPHPDNLNPLGGTQEKLTDEEYRAGKKLWPDIFGYEPVAYSEEIAAWRLATETRTDYQEHSNLIDQKILGVLGSLGTTQDNTYPYSEIQFMPNGETRLAALNYATGQCGSTIPCMKAQQDIPPWSIAKGKSLTVNEYVSLVDKMVIAGGDQKLLEIAMNAAARIEAQQQIMENDGVLAKTHLEPQPGAFSQYGELSVRVDSPVAARQASIYGIPNVLGQLATSQQASALTGLDKPGGTQLVKRGNSSDNQTPECSNGINDDNDNYIDYPEDPECASATDSSESEPGPQSAVANSGPQVAGALDLLFRPGDNFFDEEKSPTSPSANIISPILEFGARHALRVITAGTWRPGTTAGTTCGFTCN